MSVTAAATPTVRFRDRNDPANDRRADRVDTLSPPLKDSRARLAHHDHSTTDVRSGAERGPGVNVVALATIYVYARKHGGGRCRSLLFGGQTITKNRGGHPPRERRHECSSLSAGVPHTD